MKDKTTPPTALAALRSLTGALYRHGPKNSREYLSLATRLETGIWAGVQDRGIFPGFVYGKHCGTEVVVDLFLHVIGEDGTVSELPVQWAMRTPFKPIALLGVPGDTGQAPDIAPTAELSWPQYQHIHRPDLPGYRRFGDFRPRAETTYDQPVNAAQGSIYEMPMLQHYRSGADDAHDRRTICVSADFDYPMDIHIGCPVVDDFGRLAGIAVGVDPGPERSHVGMYAPADYIMPAVALAHASIEALRRGDRYDTGIERVQFWNSEVDFPQEIERERQPQHYRDQLVKVVLPRRTWDAIISQAEAGYGIDASPDAFAEVEALSAIVGE